MAIDEASVLYESPVLICGVPRSGVRLLATILHDHPTYTSGPELPFILTMVHQCRVLEATLGQNHDRHYQLSQDAVRAAFRATILSLVMPHMRRVDKRQFVFHSFGAMLILEEFVAMFPHAKVVMMIRDPRDVAVSLLQCDWRNPRNHEPLPYTKDVCVGARLWVEFMQSAFASAKALQKNQRLLILRYEDLCRRAQPVMNALGAFLSATPPQPSVNAHSAVRITASSAEPHPPLIAGPLNANRIGRWAQVLSKKDSDFIERITGPLRAQLGYT